MIFVKQCYTNAYSGMQLIQNPGTPIPLAKVSQLLLFSVYQSQH
jgi:hypothetical protein